MKLKTIVFMLLMLGCRELADAQGFLGGIFNQNQTQNQYLLQQIAALEAYHGYLQKGNAIVKDGTDGIGKIKNNDLGLHKGHQDSLKIVSPKVKNYSRVKGIITLQQQIINSHDKVYPQLTGSGQLTAAELTEYKQVYTAILQQSGTGLEELRLVVTDGQLQMGDDQRIACIDKLYAVMQNDYEQVQQMNGQALSTASQRARDGKDRETIKALYGQ